jgi:hypothetical protein
MMEYAIALVIWMAVYYFDVWSRFDSNGTTFFIIFMVLLVVSDPVIKVVHKGEKKGE